MTQEREPISDEQPFEPFEPYSDEELKQWAQGDNDHLPRLARMARELRELRWKTTNSNEDTALLKILAPYTQAIERLEAERDKLAGTLDWLFKNHERIIIEAAYAVSITNDEWRNSQIITGESADVVLKTAKEALSKLEGK